MGSGSWTSKDWNSYSKRAEHGPDIFQHQREIRV